MKKIGTIMYFTILLGLSFPSALVVWANFERHVLIIEIVANAIFLTGIIFYFKGMKIKWWAVFALLAVAGELYLLAFLPEIDLQAIAFWTTVLLPAIYMNLKICHLTT